MSGNFTSVHARSRCVRTKYACACACVGARACVHACVCIRASVCVNVWCACVRACDRACLCAGWGKCACACVSVYCPTRGSVHMCVRACVCGRRSTCLSTRQDVESLAVSSSPHSHPHQEKDAAV